MRKKIVLLIVLMGLIWWFFLAPAYGEACRTNSEDFVLTDYSFDNGFGNFVLLNHSNSDIVNISVNGKNDFENSSVTLLPQTVLEKSSFLFIQGISLPEQNSFNGELEITMLKDNGQTVKVILSCAGTIAN